MSMQNPCFSRNIGPIGAGQQRTLGNARVAVFGLGGVGGICAELLVRAGVGHLLVVDFDRFEITNFNRQIHAQKETAGKRKVDVFVKKAKSIAQEVKIKTISKKLEFASLEPFSRSLSSFSPILVIDTMDNISSRVLLSRLCKRKRMVYVYAAASGERGMVGVLKGDANLEKILHLPSMKRPDEMVESCLIHYPQCRMAWGAATNLTGALAANAGLNYLLKKPIPRAPKFWMADAFRTEIVRMEKLG